MGWQERPNTTQKVAPLYHHARAARNAAQARSVHDVISSVVLAAIITDIEESRRRHFSCAEAT